ncbi:MAG: arginine--tRNA ligase [Candidatus Pacebacteria bacterium]|nr:arginine--tRNA ligase [Candidatus Paceibacterota bacterium]
MLKDSLKERIASKFKEDNFDILTPPDEKLGDYSINLAFILAKKNKTAPMKLGEEIVKTLSTDKEISKRFSSVTLVAPGFINFFIKKEFLQEELKGIYKDRDSYGRSKIGRGETVIVEYCGTNIAKPMHVGHLRSTIIGDGLANVYKTLGYNVIRWNYIGDWGTQFGKLIAAYKIWGDKDILKKDPMGTMLDLYVKFHQELKLSPELESKGQEEFRKLENGDPENRKLWEMFRDYSMADTDKMLEILGVSFDVVKGESAYEKVLSKTINSIENAGILKESEGAQIIELENLPPALIRKSDGATLYITRDIASLRDRIKSYKPSKILYVVANQQTLHFEQLFAVAKLLGLDQSELIHVKFGMVLGEDGKKLATREGKIIELQELSDKIIDLAKERVKEKNSSLGDKEISVIGKTVGIGALKYNDLKQHPYSDIVFNWDAMLDFSGNSAAYLQYTYVRLLNILMKVKDKKKGDSSLLNSLEEERIMKRILLFPESIKKCADLNSLNSLALYLYELANDANRFYESTRIIEDKDINLRNARLMMIDTVCGVLKNGLKILGINVLNRI